jgi:hypothetical protein
MTHAELAKQRVPGRLSASSRTARWRQRTWQPGGENAKVPRAGTQVPVRWADPQGPESSILSGECRGGPQGRPGDPLGRGAVPGVRNYIHPITRNRMNPPIAPTQPIQLSLRTRAENPNHHLWNNHGTWWCHFTLHLANGTKCRVRRSLRTGCPTKARTRRDGLLGRLMTPSSTLTPA